MVSMGNQHIDVRCHASISRPHATAEGIFFLMPFLKQENEKVLIVQNTV